MYVLLSLYIASKFLLSLVVVQVSGGCAGMLALGVYGYVASGGCAEVSAPWKCSGIVCMCQCLCCKHGKL
jgi:hypothetical protein